ncbi:hypothetical protein D3C80_1738580 [compost metagenome]
MVLVLISPLRPVLIACRAQVVVLVVVVAGQLACLPAILHQPERPDAAVLVELGLDMPMLVFILIGDQV